MFVSKKNKKQKNKKEGNWGARKIKRIDYLLNHLIFR